MTREQIFDVKEELMSRGYFIESFNEKVFIVSKLKEDNGKLYYVYPGVYDGEGKHKVFDLNLREM